MLCDLCHKNIATIHLTEIVGNKVVELHLCQECSNLKTEEFKDQLSFSDFLTGLVEKREPEEKNFLSCPFCGLTFLEFKKKGRLGCGRCYETFKRKLLPLFKKIHGSVQHVGKSPQQIEPMFLFEKKMRELKDRLSRAVKLEEYEEAAKIRDQIREIEKKRDEK
ncbi:MAG: UvrB/UvrC motif-containing protein [Candidatus Omnitrophica bacterium]|nr:UvrB/UvrC motif-containing protein [Candidatus Omnitrophota bacterium]